MFRTSWLGILMICSCEYFNEPEEYSISSFDEGIAHGLIENIYSTNLDTVKLGKVFVNTSGGESDANVDSLIKITTDREAIFSMLDSNSSAITPSMSKYTLIVDTNFVNAYALLDVSSSQVGDDHMVFFFDNYLDLQIWNANGDLVEIFSNSIEWGIISVSQRTKSRFEYALSTGRYLVQFIRSQKMIKDVVDQYCMVLLPESSEPSSKSSLICSILNGSISGGQEINFVSLEDLDTNWVDENFATIYADDSLRNELIIDLEIATTIINANNFDQRIDIVKNTDIENGYVLLDFSDNSSSITINLYFNDYYNIAAWDAVDSLEVPVIEYGITYYETGACSNLRHIYTIDLENKKYFLTLTRIQGTDNPSSCQLLMTEE